MYTIGIDIGYSSIKAVLINEKKELIYYKYKLHKGKIKDNLIALIEEINTKYNIKEIKFGAVTGSGCSYLENSKEISYINDVTSIIEGSKLENSNIRSIIDIGGESAKYITGINTDRKSNLEISINSNCSSGTGSFLEEQMSRLNLNISDYSNLIKEAKSIPRIAGRCSVFAKSDITHHQQEGVSVEDILLGLAYSLIRNYKGTVIKKHPINKPIFFSGGVAYNDGIIKAIKDVLKLEDKDLIISKTIGLQGAIGAATIAQTNKTTINLDEIIVLTKHKNSSMLKSNYPTLMQFGNNESLFKHICKRVNQNQKIDCYLGIDIGSTSTNLVLIDESNVVIDFRYLRTLGDPLRAVKKGFEELSNKYNHNLNIKRVGTTGSARYLIAENIGADVIKDEITAQGRAAVAIDKDVDTIFEIGGQDSKFISIKDGSIVDFQMNKICAAGTGSFIEEQAKKFNIPINTFGDIALKSDNPINLGERCTVFIESNISSALADGAKLENIVSGLCYSIVKNYIDRVVGKKKIGNKIFFQGGVANNQGVINAFKAITKKEIIVPKFFSVTGALGVALIAKEESTNQKSLFKGLDFEIHKDIILKKKNIIEDKSDTFSKRVENIIFDNYKAEKTNKKTVGIPRALFTFGMFSMFNKIFTTLGYNVILSNPTNENTIALGQQYAMEETCYPIKLITGHVAELMEKKVDYIFFPNLVSVDHPGSQSRKNYGCSFMQLAFKIMNISMDLDKKGIELLAPTMTFHLGPQAMQESFLKMGRNLNRSPKEIKHALKQGLEAAYEFEKRLEENSKGEMSKLKENEKVFVIISKIYGVADPMLNMGIPEKLEKLGYKVLPFYDLPEVDISAEHPNMYWPFGQHILEPTKLVKKHPNFYAILLTHHGCGPDSILSHYFKEEMQNKPYLHIEVDEHSSNVGIITRVEAFINSIKNIKPQRILEIDEYIKQIKHQPTQIITSINDIDKTKEINIVNIYPYSILFKEMSTKYGFKINIINPTTKQSIEEGRQYTVTEEYFSLTALLGNFMTSVKNIDKDKIDKTTLFYPQNEGAETNGQYSRIIREKLDEEGYNSIDVISPFIEDTLLLNNHKFSDITLCLIAGDIILNAPKFYREPYLNLIIEYIKNDLLTIDYLIQIARCSIEEKNKIKYKKNILVTGETSILYDSILNNNTLKELEDKRYNIIYSPISETMLMYWFDYYNQNKNIQTKQIKEKIDNFLANINLISRTLKNHSPFEARFNTLIEDADNSVKYYAGGNGRYRTAKQKTTSNNIDGIISVNSMYENTAIVLSMLQNNFDKELNKPILNLTFDGTNNENDQIKIESFLYYL